MERSKLTSSVTSTAARVRKVSGPRTAIISDVVAVEEPLEIRIDNQSVTVTMRTPGADRELAAGFLVSEGILHQLQEISDISPHPKNRKNIINVFLAENVTVDLKRFSRNVISSSSCGLCGIETIAALRAQTAPLQKKVTIRKSVLEALTAKMSECQSTFRDTGGLHAAGIFTLSGELLALFEDIGRHNAVDKAIGSMFLKKQVPLSEHILFVSGRVSFEIIQKALAAGIPIIAAVSAPSSLAIDFAKKNNQLLIGFLREGRMNIYTRHFAVQLQG